jgi:hypothetical protein
MVELLIVGSLIAHELRGRENLASSATVVTAAETAKAGSEPPVLEVTPEPVAIALPVQSMPEPTIPEPTIIVPPKRQKSKLVASAPSLPVGSVPDLLADLLEPAAGRQVEIEEAYRAYANRCKTLVKQPVKPEEFIDPLQTFCLECRIESEQKRGRVFMLDVQLVQSGEVITEDRASLH